MRLRLAESYVVRYICTKRGAAGFFLFSNVPSIFKNVNRNAALQKKELEIATF
jgi:hypothetical protein